MNCSTCRAWSWSASIWACVSRRAAPHWHARKACTWGLLRGGVLRIAPSSQALYNVLDAGGLGRAPWNNFRLSGFSRDNDRHLANALLRCLDLFRTVTQLKLSRHDGHPRSNQDQGLLRSATPELWNSSMMGTRKTRSSPSNSSNNHSKRSSRFRSVSRSRSPLIHS